MKTILTCLALALLCVMASAQDVAMFGPPLAARPVVAEPAMFGPPCADCADCTCPEGSCDCDAYTPQIIGMTPVDEGDGSVAGAVANYSEARRLALTTGRPLIVLVGQSKAIQAAEAKAADVADAVLCVPTPADAAHWRTAGVYRYEVAGGRLVTASARKVVGDGAKTVPLVTPSITAAGGCANGQCGAATVRSTRRR